MPSRPLVCIVTPALAGANNGNWQTASRWARMLHSDYRVQLLERWQGEPADALIALHARKSAASVAQWARSRPGAPLMLVLTGTDLYRDIHTDASAQQSLALAQRLLVLHEGAVADLPPQHRAKAVACFQSTTQRATLHKTTRHLRAVMVGHLREEKDPRTYLAAAQQLVQRSDILLDHIGAALDPALGQAARTLALQQPQYRWLGALPHAATRRRIQQAHVLVHPSRMEGGAHVLMEAICSGTPVLASHVAGNVGMLGADYAGTFEPGDAAGLARWLARCRDEPAILAGLRQQCAARAPLFQPAHERATLRALLHALLNDLPHNLSHHPSHDLLPDPVASLPARLA